MEVKFNSNMGYRKLARSELKCNSCGFVTFNLRVLYKHKYKCQGRLLGTPQKCGYCKRKFSFLFLLKQHLKTCVKRRKKKFVKKSQNKLTNGTHVTVNSESKSSTIVCPICMKFFNSRTLYAAHEKSEACKPAQSKMQEKSASARKSFQKSPPPYKKNKTISESSDSDSSLVSNSLLSDIVESNQKQMRPTGRGYTCINCKNTYPAKRILLKHLDTNYRCALAHFELNFYRNKSAKAKKSIEQVVARKSFSNSHRQNNSYLSNKPLYKGSARKSLPNSFKKQSPKPFFSRLSSTVKQTSIKPANQCPVCKESFRDSFNLYQHQKKFQHWGKATKSINLSCKCPFCEKGFFSIRARNAHIRNHADQTDQIIESFLKKTTCDICSQVFESETVKLQHIKTEHYVKEKSDLTIDMINDSSKYLSLPLAIKQSLKQFPNECPICVEVFASVALRNNHFEENHLNSDVGCQFCPIRCNSEELADEHMKKFHYDQFKYACFVCKDKYPSIPHVVAHVQKLHPSHVPKSKQQSAVKSIKNSKVSLPLKQIKESLDKDQGYLCDICNLTFPKLQFLKRHEQSKQHRDTLVKNLDAVHESLSNLPPSPQVLPKNVETPKNISCSECFEEFTALKDFVPHRLSHFGEHEKYMEITEDNTYTCEICGDISDSHSKVQIHLFWHLQNESSAKVKNSAGSNNNSVVSAKSSGQHVAKKSFGNKQTREMRQEVVIGGVKKHLFTCDACNVGFTDQNHYNLHVRKFCKIKNNPLHKKTIKEDSDEAEDIKLSKTNSALNRKSFHNQMGKKEVAKTIVDVELCNDCCSMFNKSIKHIHDEICSKCKKSELEPSANVNGFKTSIKLKKAVAACLKCDCLFMSSQKFSEHMLSFHALPEEEEVLENSDNTFVLGGDFVIHCTTCNFIFFSTDTLGDHETTCTKFSYSNSRLENYTPEFKAALEQNSIISSCLNCDLAFNNTNDLTEHLAFHQKNTTSIESGESNVVILDDVSVHDETTDPSVTVSEKNSTEVLKNDLTPQDISSTLSNALSEPLTNSNDISLVPNDTPPNSSTKLEDIDSLRKNFSKLLSILVSDPDLMQQLGYGELLVDEVLVNVLQTMEQTPVLKDEKTTDLDCLRKNIQILLDFCLEDQVMALIGDGKTSTDDIVVEALKIFGGESSMSIIALE